MKKLIFVFVLCLSIGSLVAQEAAKFKTAGNEAIKVKDFAKAVENYEKAIAVWGTEPQDFTMIYNCAICAIQIKEYAKAIKYFDQTIAGNYRPDDSYLYKAVSLKAQKNNKEYLTVINEGIAKFPDNPKIKLELSQYYVSEGVGHYNIGVNLRNSASAKIKSKKYKDTKDPAYLADIEKVKKEYSDAIPFLDKALELNAADANAKTTKAKCEIQLKELQ